MGRRMVVPLRTNWQAAVLAMQNAYTDAASRVNADKTRKKMLRRRHWRFDFDTGVYTFTKGHLNYQGHHP
jgi:hypothetical protein